MSKGTDHFKKAIESYLEKRAAEDELFAKTYAKENKNIDDCIKYIYGEVRKSKRNGFTDDEIFNLAVHYYDEDDVKAGDGSAPGQVIVNHVPELTEEEKKELKEQARKEVIEEERMRLHKRTPKKKEKKQESEQPSLF